MNIIYYHAATNLGNWLFQIAFARLLGKAPIAFYVTTDIGRKKLHAFQELYPDVVYVDHLPTELTTYTDGDLVANNFLLPEQRDNLLLDGYFQYSQIYNRQNLVKMFSCPTSVKFLIQNKYGIIFSNSNTVGISVRRGDYLKLPHRHPFVGGKYLRNAVDMFDAGTTFIVCSDDISWCKKFFTQKQFPDQHFVFIEKESVLTQLYIHTFCCHNIISNSTFSWWGAYLNNHTNQRVIFPSRWYGLQIKEKCYLYFCPSEVVKSTYSLELLLKAVYCCTRTFLGSCVRRILKGCA